VGRVGCLCEMKTVDRCCRSTPPPSPTPTLSPPPSLPEGQEQRARRMQRRRVPEGQEQRARRVERRWVPEGQKQRAGRVRVQRRRVREGKKQRARRVRRGGPGAARLERASARAEHNGHLVTGCGFAGDGSASAVEDGAGGGASVLGPGQRKKCSRPCSQSGVQSRRQRKKKWSCSRSGTEPDTPTGSFRKKKSKVKKKETDKKVLATMFPIRGPVSPTEKK
jgi:hypothetical protein